MTNSFVRVPGVPEVPGYPEYASSALCEFISPASVSWKEQPGANRLGLDYMLESKKITQDLDLIHLLSAAVSWKG